jgi:hypothetical protein
MNRNELEIRSFPYDNSFTNVIHSIHPVSTLYLSNFLAFVGTK